jgi:hypothetical protein
MYVAHSVNVLRIRIERRVYSFRHQGRRFRYLHVIHVRMYAFHYNICSLAMSVHSALAQPRVGEEASHS